MKCIENSLQYVVDAVVGVEDISHIQIIPYINVYNKSKYMDVCLLLWVDG